MDPIVETIESGYAPTNGAQDAGGWEVGVRSRFLSVGLCWKKPSKIKI
jgi:hypothetical protein